MGTILQPSELEKIDYSQQGWNNIIGNNVDKLNDLWQDVIGATLADKDLGELSLTNPVTLFSIINEPISSGWFYNVVITNEDIISVYDTWVALVGSKLIYGKVIITDNPMTQTYTEGTDYEVDYNGGQIKVLSTGNIPNSTSILIDYEYVNTTYIMTDEYVDGTGQSDNWLKLIHATIISGSIIVEKISDLGTQIQEYIDVVDEDFSGWTYDNPQSLTFTNISNVVVEPDGGGTAFIEGTDYTVDYTTGMITILTSGTITPVGTALDVDYRYKNYEINYINGKFKPLNVDTLEPLHIDYEYAQWVKLTKRYIFNPVVTDVGGSITYIEDIDYNVNRYTGEFKPISGGTIPMGDQLEISYDHPLVEIIDENIISNDGVTYIDLTHYNLIPSTIIITDTIPSVPFIEGVHYEIKYPEGQIKILDLTTIPDLTNLLVDYHYQYTSMASIINQQLDLDADGTEGSRLLRDLWIYLGFSNILNVVVTNNIETITYTEETDYKINYDTGKIKVLTTGSIPDAASLYIDFNYVQMSSSDLIDSSNGIVSQIINDVTATPDQKILNNNFASLVDEVDKLKTDNLVLRSTVIKLIEILRISNGCGVLND